MTADPFRHVPALRDRIRPPAQSYFRTISPERVRATLREKGLPDVFPFYPEDTREALRAEALSGHTGDLWIFAYGSLIWDPALEFCDLRRAHAPGHQRRFILVDVYGGRGTAEAPGLMAALDTGSGCDGVAFRIAAQIVDRETEILFRREMIGPGYLARFVPVLIDGEPARALTFLADHADPLMRPDITRDEQVRYAATGTGFLGTSFDYLADTVSHLAEVGIDDPDARDLLDATRAARARLKD